MGNTFRRSGGKALRLLLDGIQGMISLIHLNLGNRPPMRDLKSVLGRRANPDIERTGARNADLAARVKL
jgi:hypothetical protein